MISSLSSPSPSTGATRSASAPTRPKPEAVFQQLDSGGKGYLTQDDLVKISPQGAKAADAAKAAEAFQQMDADGNGQVSQSEFKQAAPPPAPPGGKPQGAEGGKGPPPPPAPPAGAAGSRGASPSEAASSSPSEIDPADANQDGKVSQQEQLAYDTEQAAKKATSQVGSKATDEAVKTYAAVAQASEVTAD